MHEIDIMDIGGFKIGQAEDTKGLTGCTVFLFDKQSPAWRLISLKSTWEMLRRSL